MESNQSESSFYQSTSNISKIISSEFDEADRHVRHNQTVPATMALMNNTTDELDGHQEPPGFTNSTPKKQHSKSFRHAGSATNMNTYAFMSTYNILPSSAKASALNYMNNSVGSESAKKEKNKKPWYSVSEL